MYYVTAYSIAGIGFFATVLFVTQKTEKETIDAFNGLGKSHPLMAFVLTISLLSMAGIPILSGFFAKFFLLNQLVLSGWLVVVIVAIIASIISVGYYFKIILAMFTQPSETEFGQTPIVYKSIAIIAIIINLIIGLYPNLILNLV